MRPALLCAAIVAVWSPALARAQHSETVEDAAEARALFEAGSEHLAAQRYEEASQAFERSFALAERPGTAANLAVALREAGRPADSVALFDRLLGGELGEISDEMRQLVEIERAEAEARQCHLELGAARDAMVQIDGAPAFALTAHEPARRALNPGSHVIVASAPGRAQSEVHVVLGPGATERIELTFRPVAPADPPRRARSPRPVPEPTPPSDDVTASGWFWFAIVAAALAVGGAITATVLLWPQRDVGDPPVDPVFGTIRALTIPLE